MQEPANGVQQVPRGTWTRTRSNDDELNRLMVETLEQGLSQARGQAVRILQLRRQVLRTTTSFQTEHLVGTYRSFRGFRWGSVLNVSSGPPYNITTGFDNDHDTEANDRPPGVTRNTGHGPAYADVDLRLSRVFALAKDNAARQLEFGADAFNVFKHVNLENYGGTLTSARFGQAIAAYSARQVQLSFRWRF